MVTKRSRGGLRVGPPRYFYFPWEEQDRRARRERELAREVRQWDEDRIRRFEEDQRRKREWISFVKIAEWYSDLIGPAEPKTAAAAHERAYQLLESDLLVGFFEEGGRSRVRFVFPGVNWTHGKMTRKWLKEAIDYNLDNEHGRTYLEHCWLPKKLFRRWCARHDLPESPQRFEPQESHPVPVATAGDETAAIKALASYLRTNRDMKKGEARSLCHKAGFKLTGRGFQNRVWPTARVQAGLEAKARAGRNRKPSR